MLISIKKKEILTRVYMKLASSNLVEPRGLYGLHTGPASQIFLE